MHTSPWLRYHTSVHGWCFKTCLLHHYDYQNMCLVLLINFLQTLWIGYVGWGWLRILFWEQRNSLTCLGDILIIKLQHNGFVLISNQLLIYDALCLSQCHDNPCQYVHVLAFNTKYSSDNRSFETNGRCCETNGRCCETNIEYSSNNRSSETNGKCCETNILSWYQVSDEDMLGCFPYISEMRLESSDI